MIDNKKEQEREELVDTKGYFILPSELFCNVRGKAPQNENLNETLVVKGQSKLACRGKNV